MKVLFVILFMLTACAGVHAQQATDPIIRSRGFLGWKYEQTGKPLVFKDMFEVMKENKGALSELKTANVYHGLGSVFTLTGGFLLAYATADAVSGRDVSSTLLLSGGAAAVVAYALNRAEQRHTMLAVDLYNYKPAGARVQSSMRVGPGGLTWKLIF